MPNNIFSFAKKELSQDALLCYLVAYASVRDASAALREFGRNFVRFLFRAGAKPDESSVPVITPGNGEPTHHSGDCEIGVVRNLEMQYAPRGRRDKIDVFFQAEVDGKTVSFLIEDKTGTGAHSNQLARYLDAVRTDDQLEDFIKPIYLKTGYIYSNERVSVEANHYSIVTADDFLHFLEDQNVTRNDEILRQYEENLRHIVNERAVALEHWDMRQYHVQWEFMLRLQKLIPAEKPQPGTWNGVKNGPNNDGSPWTQYVFSFDDHRGLFWRIDAWKPLRLMRLGGDPRRVREDDQPAFRQLADEIGGLQRPDFRSKSGREMTIGAIAFPQDPGRMDDFVERVARLHRGFLQRTADGSD